MKLLREYIRELLAEDAIGFVQDLTASEDLTPDDSSGSRRDQTYIGKKAGRAVKRALLRMQTTSGYPHSTLSIGCPHLTPSKS